MALFFFLWGPLPPLPGPPSQGPWGRALASAASSALAGAVGWLWLGSGSGWALALAGLLLRISVGFLDSSGLDLGFGWVRRLAFTD